MGNETKGQTSPVETAVKDFIRFLPEEKRDDYELMLRRCNFHDSDDPLFPIMLFLLFFQESVSDNVDRIEDSIAELKAAPQKSRKTNIRKTVAVVHFGLIALTIVNLVLFGCGLFRQNPRPVLKAVKTTAETAQSELQEINRYWTRKLEEGPEIRQCSGADRTFAMIAVTAAVSAWIPAVIVLLRGKRLRFPGKRTDPATEKNEPKPKE